MAQGASDHCPVAYLLVAELRLPAALVGDLVTGAASAAGQAHDAAFIQKVA